MHGQSDLRCIAAHDDGRAGRDRLAAQAEAESFYGVVPEHVWVTLRHGDELGRDVAAAAGLVRWRRQALRRAGTAIRRLQQAGASPDTTRERVLSGFRDARRLYRAAQNEHRTLLDERWRRKLASFRNAAE